MSITQRLRLGCRGGVVGFLTLTVLWSCGCQTQRQVRSYQTIAPHFVNDRSYAKEANERGLNFAEADDYQSAEAAFREALRADLSYAAGHNNLGLVLLRQSRFYEAALEFSFAGKLDRTAVEPVLNLARLYEAVGWRKAAIEQYEKAMEVDPESATAAERLARVRMISGVSHTRSGRELERLVRNGKPRNLRSMGEARPLVKALQD